jgi:hypothetical protein
VFFPEIHPSPWRQLELSHASLDINLDTGNQPQAAAAAGEVTVRLTASCAVPTTGEGETVAPGVRRFQTHGPAGTPQVVGRLHLDPEGGSQRLP